MSEEVQFVKVVSDGVGLNYETNVDPVTAIFFLESVKKMILDASFAEQVDSRED